MPGATSLGPTEQRLVSKIGLSIDHHPMLMCPNNQYPGAHGEPAKEAQEETA